MTKSLIQGDFLKLSSLLAPGYLLTWQADQQTREEDPESPNFLIVVYDTFSADQMSLHGYARETTPNISHLAEKAIVYHTHYAAGHWTYPGKANLLTGVYSWAHRGSTLDTELREVQKSGTGNPQPADPPSGALSGGRSAGRHRRADPQSLNSNSDNINPI